MGMMHPLQILKQIAHMSPCQLTRDQIERWITECVGEFHYKVSQHRPFNDEHAKYSLELAKHDLGKAIAEHSNMYPTWRVDGGIRELHMSTLYFKNEYGQELAPPERTSR